MATRQRVLGRWSPGAPRIPRCLASRGCPHSRAAASRKRPQLATWGRDTNATSSCRRKAIKTTGVNMSIKSSPTHRGFGVTPSLLDVRSMTPLRVGQSVVERSAARLRVLEAVASQSVNAGPSALAKLRAGYPAERPRSTGDRPNREGEHLPPGRRPPPAQRRLEWAGTRLTSVTQTSDVNQAINTAKLGAGRGRGLRVSERDGAGGPSLLATALPFLLAALVALAAGARSRTGGPSTTGPSH
jgi:hypothetical protein